MKRSESTSNNNKNKNNLTSLQSSNQLSNKINNKTFRLSNQLQCKTSQNLTIKYQTIQSIKQQLFQLQIDHQIAKCLNTLDRQGLKYLKETIKFSNLFQSTILKGIQQNDQKMRESQQIIKKQQNVVNNQNKSDVDSNKKMNSLIKRQVGQDKNKNKKIELPNKIKQKAVQYKKQQVSTTNQIKNNNNKYNSQGNMNRVTKKIVIENKKTHQKISLSEKINKKMLQYNINKVGSSKKQTKKQTKSNQNNLKRQKQPVVEQQIHIQQQQQQQQFKEKTQKGKYNNDNDDDSECVGISEQIENDQVGQVSENNQSRAILQKEEPIKLNENKINPLLLRKRNKEENVINQERSIWVDQKKMEGMQQSKQRLGMEKVQQKSFISQSVQVKDSNGDDKKINNYQQNNELRLIMSKIYNLSPEKLTKLQRVLEHMDNQQQNLQTINIQPESTITIESQVVNDKQDEKQMEMITSPQAIQHYLREKNKKNNKEKKEKASSLFNHSKSSSRIKIRVETLAEQQKNQQPQIQTFQANIMAVEIKKDQVLLPSSFQKNNSSIISQGRQLKMERLNFGQNAQNKNQVKNNQVKLINLATKRILTNKQQIAQQLKTIIKFKIISNHGHQTMFGLTGIQLFSLSGDQFNIKQQNLITNNQNISLIKLSKLFNNINLTTNEQNMYMNILTRDEIVLSLDKQNDKIGGIKVYNFNKSSLESSKQVREMEIYHNETKIWKGELRRGCYNDYEDYSTEIEVMSGFRFGGNEENLKVGEIVKKKVQHSWIQSAYDIKKQIEQIQQQQEKELKGNNQRKNNKGRLGYHSLKDKEQSNNQTGRVNGMRLAENKLDNNINNNVNNDDKKPEDNKIELTKAKSNSRINSSSNYDDFDVVLKGFEESINKSKSKSKIIAEFSSSPAVQNKSLSKQVKKDTNINVNNDSMMNDSLFKQKPTRINRIYSTKKHQIGNQRVMIQEKKQNQIQSFRMEQKNINKNDKTKIDFNIDDFLGELDDVMNKDNKEYSINKQMTRKIVIPSLPRGVNLVIQIQQNWGHPAWVGLQTIEFFDQNGNIFTASHATSNKSLSNNNIDLTKHFQTKKSPNNTSSLQQTKFGYDKGTTPLTTIQFNFNSQKTFSMIRLWNYNGQRVHSNIGVRYCTLRIGQLIIFKGQIRKNQGNIQNFYKYSQTILLTSDQSLIKKIKDNDWVYKYRIKLKESNRMFKSTLHNMNEINEINEKKLLKKQEKENVVIKKQNINKNKQIKLPKRMCWEYQPPQLPEGNIITFILHDTWGDKTSIGLDGVEIFDENGEILTKQRIKKIKTYPNQSSNDKNLVENFFSGSNCRISWLVKYQSDLQKLESGKQNIIVFELAKKIKISGINIFNYSKSSQKGVRQIEIQINSLIVFRGYIRLYSNDDSEYHTTINFTKDIKILEKLNYQGYNQDTLDQNIVFVNQKKIIRF